MLIAGADDLPWWRVVPASGRLAPHLVKRQTRQLRAEGVAVIDGRLRPPRRDPGAPAY
jgi:methylated-DNA-[protein]-cysteine S-methyltransferase